MSLNTPPIWKLPSSLSSRSTCILPLSGGRQILECVVLASLNTFAALLLADMNEARTSEPATAAAGSSNQESCLLEIDGGGVRGLSSLYIETAYAIDSKNPQRPCEYFDMICGTTTGGLVALMLGRLTMGIDEAIAVYMRLIPDILTRKRHRLSKGGNLRGHYDSNAFQMGSRILKELKLDEDTLLASQQVPCKT